VEQYGRSYLLDPNVPDDIMLAYGPEQSVTIRSGLTALSMVELSTIEDDLAEGREPGIAETLLSDALFLSQEAEVIDGQRAILSVASACEIKTKATLRQGSDAGNPMLLDLVLGRVSNLAGLLNQPYAAVFGRPLSQEDSDLFKKMQRITKLRDLVIHRGESVDRTEAWQLAVAGRQLFELLSRKLQA